MQRYKNFAISEKVCIFASSMPREMAMMVEELSCLTNHHLEENSSLVYNIGIFVLPIGTSVHDCRWFVVNQ